MDPVSLEPGPSSPLLNPPPRAPRCTAIGGIGQIPSAPRYRVVVPFPDLLGLGKPASRLGDLPPPSGSHEAVGPGRYPWERPYQL